MVGPYTRCSRGSAWQEQAENKHAKMDDMHGILDKSYWAWRRYIRLVSVSLAVRTVPRDRLWLEREQCRSRSAQDKHRREEREGEKSLENCYHYCDAINWLSDLKCMLRQRDAIASGSACEKERGGYSSTFDFRPWCKSGELASRGLSTSLWSVDHSFFGTLKMKLAKIS